MLLQDFKKYPLTYGLIIINIIIYLITANASHNFIDMNNQVLLNMGATYGPKMALDGQWWRLFSAMFLHAGIMHIGMNMYSLQIVGKGMESYFKPIQYLIIYLLSGMVGSVVSVYMHAHTLGIGASGAIFGVFGALAGFFLAHKDEIAKQSKAFFATFGSVIALNLFMGLSIQNIDMSAHIGGLISGFIGGYLVSKNPKYIWVYCAFMIIVIIGIAKSITL